MQHGGEPSELAAAKSANSAWSNILCIPCSGPAQSSAPASNPPPYGRIYLCLYMGIHIIYMYIHKVPRPSPIDIRLAHTYLAISVCIGPWGVYVSIYMFTHSHIHILGGGDPSVLAAAFGTIIIKTVFGSFQIKGSPRYIVHVLRGGIAKQFSNKYSHFSKFGLQNFDMMSVQCCSFDNPRGR